MLPSISPFGEQAVVIAQSKLGMKETNGKNKGPIVAWSIQAWTNEPPDDWAAWCMGFACTCLLQAGAPIRKIGSLSCSTFWDRCLSLGWAWERRDFQERLPAIGDVIFFATGATPHHAGLVESVDPTSKTITTIEGNASNSVIERTYELFHDSTLGYARIP